MRSVGSDIAAFLDKSQADGGLAVRIARNNDAFARSVRRVWADNPAAATFVLAHVNTLYFKRESAQRAAVRGCESYGVLDVYLDDSMARAELNARREILLAVCRGQGLAFDELRIHASVRAMRDRRAYPDPASAGAEPRDASGAPAQPRRCSRDASAVLQDFKRAVVMALGSVDLAAAALDQVQAAALEERWPTRRDETIASRKERPAVGYWVHLFVDAERRPTMARLFAAYAEPLREACADMGLRLQGVVVNAASAEMAGHHAFPRSGHPRVLRNADQGRLRSLRCETSDSR